MMTFPVWSAFWSTERDIEVVVLEDLVAVIDCIQVAESHWSRLAVGYQRSVEEKTKYDGFVSRRTLY